jgi:hypothetical protein
MKKILLSILTLLAMCSGVNAQLWETVGTEGFTSGDVQYGCMDVYNGTPYIAYKDVANGSKCTVMRFNGTSWVFLGIQAFTPGIAREQSIAIDQQNGDVYVEYSDATVNKIVVSKFNDNNGVWAPLGPNGYASSPGEFYQQIKIDNGIPYLVYGGYQASLKQYTDGTPTGTWGAISAPVISMSQAWFTRMAVDGSDQYVIYSDMASAGKATVAKVNASGVTAVGGVLGFTTGGIGYADITMDGSTPYISYQDSLVGRKISVMKFNGTSWDYVGSQGLSSGNVENNRILVYNSIPYIAFHDESDGNIHVQKFDGTNWVSVGSAVSNGQVYLNDMVINDDHVFIAYRDAENFGGKMTVKKFDLNAPNGVNEFTEMKLNIYPNPVQNELFFELDNVEFTEMTILDYSGRVVKSITNNTVNSIDVSDLNQGIYILKVITENGFSTNRFVKQ